jgi:hypothetical protein
MLLSEAEPMPDFPDVETQDPADDGPEIRIIRVISERPQEWYDFEIDKARQARYIEAIKTSNAELEFCRKVGIL